MNRLMNSGLATFGMGRDRGKPPPRLVMVAPGLLVTEQRAEAWYLIPTKNSQLALDNERDADLDQVTRFATKFMAERECHLKIVWGRVSGTQYAAEVAAAFTNGNGDAWADVRGQRIDELRLPQRFVMLGVQLADRDPRDTSHLKGSITDLLGLGTSKISEKELGHLSALVRQLGQQLRSSPWQARLASAEEIGWMIGREMHRDALAVPRNGTVTGASLARLAAGKAVPYSDHLRIYDVRNDVASYTAVLTMDDFDEVMETPGPGEWLKTLSEVTYISDDAEGEEQAVNVEASVRFTVLRKSAAEKIVNQARSSAKEQSRHASQSSAGEPSDEIGETEDLMSQLRRDIKRDGMTLVEDHPRLVVNGATREELDVNVAAVIQHFADLGVAVNVGANEQRDLWLETLPGDRLRVVDLGHIREASAFFGSSFWCGSRVGDRTGPAIGVLTGSTPGIVRNDVAAGSARGDSTTTVMIGRSGRGKSTSIMLSALDASIMGAWTVVFDLKGDLAGVVDVARDYDIPAAITRISPKYAGAADLMRFLSPEEAVLHVPAQLMLIAPRELRGGAESLLVEAVRAELELEQHPTSWGVIQRLKHNSEHAPARRLGEALHALTQDGLGSIVAGQPTEAAPLTTAAGLWLIQMPGLVLPDPTSDPEQWNPVERVSMAALRGVLTWIVQTTGSQVFRRRAKVVCVPEVHLLDKTNDGSAFLNRLARMGRAFGTSLVLDTQDSETITNNPGLAEQVNTAFVFALRSAEQIVGALSLLQLPDNESTRELIRSINTDPNGEIRHGHCLMRDRYDQLATMQWEYPDARIAAQLNTNPDAGQGDYDNDEDGDVA